MRRTFQVNIVHGVHILRRRAHHLGAGGHTRNVGDARRDLVADAFQLFGHGHVLAQHTTGHQRLGAGLLHLQDLGGEILLALLVDLGGHDLQVLGLRRALEAGPHVFAIVVVLGNERPLFARMPLGHLGHELGHRVRHVVAYGEHVLDDRLVQALVRGNRCHRGNAGLLDQRHRCLRLRRAGHGCQGEHLVAVDQLAHALHGARRHVAVILGDQPNLSPVDAAGGVHLGHRRLDAQVVGNAQQRRRARQRQDVPDQDF